MENTHSLCKLHCTLRVYVNVGVLRRAVTPLPLGLVGSNPSILINGKLPKWFKGTGCYLVRRITPCMGSNPILSLSALLMELVDMQVLETCALTGVRVQLSLGALLNLDSVAEWLRQLVATQCRTVRFRSES